MKITQDLREYAVQKEIDEQAPLGVGMKEKAEEFVAAGGEIYQGTERIAIVLIALPVGLSIAE